MIALIFHPRIWRTVAVTIFFVIATTFAVIFNYKWLRMIHNRVEYRNWKGYINGNRLF